MKKTHLLGLVSGITTLTSCSWPKDDVTAAVWRRPNTASVPMVKKVVRLKNNDWADVLEEQMCS